MPLPSGLAVKRQGSDDGVFRILTVCSGNLCRSPQAELLLRLRIPAAFGRARMAELDISSAGTRARDGEPMDGYAAAEAKRLGAKGAEHHLTRRIRAAHVEQADLVIGMAREHRAAATSIVPSANRRAFTLVEFARILDALMTREIEGGVAPIGPDGFAAFLQRVVSAAYIARGLVLATRNPDDLDIVDPYRRDPGVYRESADAVDALTRRVATAIRALAS